MVDIETFRKRLLDERTELERSVEAAEPSTRPVELDQESVGRLSRMDAIQHQQMALALQRRNAQRIARIDAALKRIDEGEYGYCVQCGAEIPERRLDLDPASPLCIECAEKA